jgi:hypothetical protein
MSQRTPAKIRDLVACLRGNAQGLDLLHRVLADLDPTLCVHVPPPNANVTAPRSIVEPLRGVAWDDAPYGGKRR